MAEFRVYYFTKAGKRTKKAHASVFSLFYGKKIVTLREPLPVRTIVEKDWYIREFAKDYNKKIKRIARKRAETIKRQKEPLKYEKIVKRIRKEPVFGYKIETKTVVDKKTGRKKKIREKVKIIIYFQGREELETYSKKYDKELLHRSLCMRDGFEKIRRTTLNFTLTKSLKIDNNTVFREERKKLINLFYPHMLKFIKENNKKTNKVYLGRIKYRKLVKTGKRLHYIDNGFGSVKTQVSSRESMKRFTLDIFSNFVFSNRDKGLNKYMYTSENGAIEITGFTIECYLGREKK